MDHLPQYIRRERLSITSSFQRILVCPCIEWCSVFNKYLWQKKSMRFSFQRSWLLFYPLMKLSKKDSFQPCLYSGILYWNQISTSDFIKTPDYSYINKSRMFFPSYRKCNTLLSLCFFYTGQNPAPSRVATSTRPPAGGAGRIAGGAQRSQGISRPGQQPARSTGGAGGASAALMQKDAQIQELNDKVCWVAF